LVANSDVAVGGLIRKKSLRTSRVSDFVLAKLVGFFARFLQTQV